MESKGEGSMYYQLQPWIMPELVNLLELLTVHDALPISLKLSSEIVREKAQKKLINAIYCY